MSSIPGPGVLRKAAWRLLPFLCVLYIVNILNRSNVGFAGLTMRTELGISDAVFDLGYGIFYFGYLAFQMPANLLLPRVGARRWIALLLIAWGLVSSATMLVTGPTSLYLMRILLGVAQAGFFPGVILYLTYWFPNRERARVIAFFMVAISISGVVGNPLSGAIMEYLDGAAGWSGWQWLFLLEGSPAVGLGLCVFLFLPDGPDDAVWLAAAEREWLRERLAQDGHSQQKRDGGKLMRALLDPQVWLLIGVYVTVAVGSNAAGPHFPKLVNKWFEGENKAVIGRLLALPHLCAIVGMTLISMNSDRTGERRGHVCFSAFLAAAGWVLAARAEQADSPWLALTGLCMAQTGMMSMLPCFWAMPTAFLSGAAAAGGIALINSVGNIGGLMGPTILGQYGLESMAIILAGGGILVLTVRREEAQLA